MNQFPLVELGTVASLRRDRIQIDDAETYKRCRVRLRGQGVVLRDEVEGSAIRTKSQQVCQPNDLVVAEIDAKVGGFGLVPDALDGAIVSSHYFLYDLDAAQILPAFLGWYLRTDAFMEQVAARGSTNYAAIRSSDVLKYFVPLPPMSVQVRIAGALDGAWEGLEGAQRAQASVNATLALLPGLVLSELCASAPLATLGVLCPDIRGGVWGDPPDDRAAVVLRAGNISRDGRVVLADVVTRSIPPKSLGTQQLRTDDIILTKSNSLDVVGSAALFKAPEDDTRPFVAGNFLVRLRPDKSQCLPEFLWSWLRTPQAKAYFRRSATGTSPSLQNLTQSTIASLPMPLLSTTDQANILLEVASVASPASPGPQAPAHGYFSGIRAAALRAAFG